MKATENNIGFALRKISTIRFATIEEVHKKKGEETLTTSVKFGINKEAHYLSVLVTIQYEKQKSPFLLAEVACDFNIVKPAWEKFKVEGSDAIEVPKGFITHLTVLTIGTVRGILHAKTEGTIFNGYVLPTLNVSELVTENIRFQ